MCWITWFISHGVPVMVSLCHFLLVFSDGLPERSIHSVSQHAQLRPITAQRMKGPSLHKEWKAPHCTKNERPLNSQRLEGSSLRKKMKDPSLRNEWKVSHCSKNERPFNAQIIKGRSLRKELKPKCLNRIGRGRMERF